MNIYYKTQMITLQSAEIYKYQTLPHDHKYLDRVTYKTAITHTACMWLDSSNQTQLQT